MPEFIAASVTCSRLRLLFLLMIPMLFTGCQDLLSPAPDAPAFALVAVEPTDPQMIGSGYWHTCAVRPDGVIGCWGTNAYGESPATKTAATGQFTQVAASTSHTCGLRSDGVVECWGESFYGEASATRTAATGSFTQVTAGQDHTCALRTDGVVQCWGDTSAGQTLAIKTAVSGHFTQVSAGYMHACALRSDGVVECWGAAGGWNLGQAPATKTAASGRFVFISAGGYHTCGLRADGVIECWGYNAHEQAPLQRAAATGSFTQLGAGAWHTCAVRSDGTIECWGRNHFGQAPATKVADGGVFAQVAGGDLHTCAMRTGGPVECWGANDDGQTNIGLPPAVPSSVTATEGSNQFTVSWTDASTSEIWFRVVRRSRTSTIGNWSEWVALDDVIGATQFVDAASAGQVYQYRVRACNLAGCSIAVDAATQVTLDDAAPAAPVFSAVTAVSATQIDVEWGDVATESTYQLQRRASDPVTGWGVWSSVSTLAADDVSHSDLTVVTGRYAYRLRACNGAGCSAWAVSETVSTDVPPISPTLTLSGTATAGASYAVQWTDNSDNETRFVVQRSGRATGAWGAWSAVGEAAADETSLQDVIPAGVDWLRYRVRACNATGCSAWSAAGVIDVTP